MNRSYSGRTGFLAFLLTISVAGLYADNTVSSTTVYTQPAGALFYVDGQQFTSAATFLWPQGSKHTLSISPVQQSYTNNTQYAFTGWKDSTGILATTDPVVVVTADPGITWFEATLTLQYAITLDIINCPPGPGACRSPGTVFVNNTPYSVSTNVYVNAGSVVTLQAVPSAGYVFNGWLGGIGNSSQAFLNSFTLNGPVVVAPQFLTAVVVTMATNPPGLQVLADRTAINTPVTLNWGIGTTHMLGAPPWQLDLHGNLWVFSSWSDGGNINHAYTTAPGNTLTLTATFVRGGNVAFLSNPQGLNLVVDGIAVGPPYNFVWSAGVPHTISAPPQQVDLNGNGWAFQSWSNGGAATQTVTLTAAQVAAGFRLTAAYAPSNQTTGQITVQSSPPGVDILENGVDCITPCTIQSTIGSQVYLSAPASVQAAPNTRLALLGWVDGAPATRTITVTSGTQTFTANYQSAYLLTATASPAGAATLHFAPSSPDGFYAAPASVTISATAGAGYRFDQWGGDASGTSPNVTVVMSQPHTLQAVLDRTGNDGIDAISNAAGTTPENAVAPGSIISITGPKLASETASGPASPLAQTLAGVTVTVGEQLLPLIFVSPGQINAQLPSSLAPGQYTLTVQSTGQPGAIGIFTVERNAPGLFSHEISGQPYWIAMHADGSYVTPARPARRGETVTGLGTGFGPFQPRPPDGFAVPASGVFPLVDRVELEFSDKTLQPVFTGAAVGHVGVTAVRFLIADPLPAASTIEVKAQVNGQASNTVLLPME